jgi:hypothetical protein
MSRRNAFIAFIDLVFLLPMCRHGGSLLQALSRSLVTLPKSHTHHQRSPIANPQHFIKQNKNEYKTGQGK